MSKKALKAAGFLAGTAAVAGAAAFTVTKILVDTALDRDMPRVMKNSDNLISGSGTDPEKIESALKKGDELEAMRGRGNNRRRRYKAQRTLVSQGGRQESRYRHARMAFLLEKGFRDLRRVFP